MRLFPNRFKLMHLNNWQKLVIALLVVFIVPSHAYCAETNWRKQLNDIGQGVTKTDLMEKRLILTKALEESEKTKLSNFPEYAEIVLSLADNYANEDSYPKAERCLADAAYLTPYPSDDKDPIKFPSGDQSPQMVAKINRHLGWLEARKKQYQYALKSYALTQRIWTDLWGAKDPRLAAIKNDLATLQYERGELSKAAESLREAIQLTEQVAKQSIFTTTKWRSKRCKVYKNTLNDSEKNAMLDR